MWRAAARRRRQAFNRPGAMLTAGCAWAISSPPSTVKKSQSPNDLFLLLEKYKSRRCRERLGAARRQNGSAEDCSGSGAVEIYGAPIGRWLSLNSFRAADRGRCLIVVPLVGRDDLLHEMMARDVFFGKRDKSNAVHALAECAKLPFSPEGFARRQIDLRGVAGDHRFRAVA